MKKLRFELTKLIKKRVKDSIIAKIALVLAVFIVFCTTYLLILPALTVSTGSSSSVIQSTENSSSVADESRQDESSPEVLQKASNQTESSESAANTTDEAADMVAAGTLSAETSEVTVTVTYEDNTFSEPVTLKVNSVSDTSAINDKLTSELSKTKQRLSQAYSYDISFVTASGEEVEPSKDVNVSLAFKNAVGSSDLQSGWKLYHFVDNDINNVEDLTNKSDTTINQDSSDSATGVDFKSDSFSTYTVAGVTYTNFSDYLTSDTTYTNRTVEQPTYSETTEILTTGIKLSYQINKEDLEANGNDYKYAIELPADTAWTSITEGQTYKGTDEQNNSAFEYEFVQDGDKKYILITFLEDYVNNAGTYVKGNLEYTATIGSTYRNEDGSYTITYSDDVKVEIPSDEIKVVPKEDEAAYDVSSSKKGSVEYDGDEAELIYTVTVSSNKGTNGDITLKDALSGSDLGDITIDSVTIDSITKSDGSSVSVPSKEDGDDKKSFTMTLSQLGAGESYTIKYRYKVSNFPAGKAYTIKNTVNLESPDIDNPGNSSYQVIIERNKITKTGKYDSDSNTITWEIKVNENQNDIAGATLSDDMFSNAIGGSITISPSDGIEKTSDGYKFTAVSGGKNTNTYTITYKTDAGDVPDSWAQSKNSVTNTVTLTDDGETSTAEKTVDTGEGDTGGLEKTLEKSEDGEDASTKILTWKSVISVPGDGTIPAGTEFTDTLMAGNNNDWDSHYYTKDQIDDIYQTLVSILGEGNFEFSIWESGQATWQYTSYDQISSDKTYRQFKFKLLSAYTGNDITLEYKSTATNLSTTINFTNTISTKGFSSTANYRYESESKITKMDGKEHTSDGKDFQANDTSHTINSDGTIFWRVKINLDDSDQSVTIVDTPPADLQLVDFKFGYLNQESGGSNISITDTSISWINPWWKTYPKIDMSGTISSDGKITATFTAINGTTLKQALNNNDALYVVYEFKYTGDLPLDDDLVLSLTNEASATIDGVPAGEDDHTQTITIEPSKKISKSGEWHKNDTTDDIRGVHYTLKLNPEAQDLNPDSDTYEVTDTLTYVTDVTTNISYDLIGSSVKLLDSSGNEVTDGWSWTVEKVQEGLTVKSVLKVVVPDEQAYTLKYVYAVSGDIKNNTSLTVNNTASIEGMKTGSTEYKYTYTWEEADTSGTATTDKYFKFTKVDAENFRITLKGATFNVYEYGTDSLVASYVTNDDGVFYIYKDLSGAAETHTSLKQDTLYYVKEVTPPPGYDLSDEVYYFYYSEDSALPSNLGSEFPGDTSQILNLATHSKVENVKDKELPPTVSLTVNKEWFTADGEKTERSDGSITYDVIQVATAEDGTSTESTYKSGETLSHDDNWTKTYSDLPASGTDSNNNKVNYTYYVKETAVSGYDTSYSNSNGDSSTNAVDMAIASDSAEITIENTAQKQYALPETGGNGTQWYYITGAIVSLLTLSILIFKIYKRYQMGGHL